MKKSKTSPPHAQPQQEQIKQFTTEQLTQASGAGMNPLYKSGKYVKGPNQSVPDWDNGKALTIFQGMLTKTNNKIDAVAAANDGLANSVISALHSKLLVAELRRQRSGQ